MLQSYRDLFGTMLTPKMPELIAAPYRFGGDKIKAREHFENGLQKVFTQLRKRSHPDYPLTVYYAFKQEESDNDNEERASTGWETMLEGLTKADFQVTGTWPVRTEMETELVEWLLMP